MQTESSPPPSSGLSPMQTGIILVVTATMLLVAMDSIAKLLTQRYEPLYVVWARYTGQAVATLIAFAPSLRARMRTARPRLQVMRSGLLFAATMLFFYGFQTLPLAVVAAVGQTAPLFITALAAMLLGEKVGVHRWASVAFGFAGALVILRPGFGAGWEVMLPLGGALAFAAYSIATKFLSGHDSAWTTFLYTGLVGAVGASLFAPFVWETPDLADAPLLAFMGVIGGLGQLLLIIAFSHAPASALAPFLYAGLVWSMLVGWLAFGEAIDATTLIGSGMIVCAGLYVRYRERRRGDVIVPALPRADR